MPYKSKKQQRYMNAVHPEIAARWNQYPMPKYQASSNRIPKEANYSDPSFFDRVFDLAVTKGSTEDKILGFTGDAFDKMSKYGVGEYLPDFVKQPIKDLAFNKVRPGPYPRGEGGARHIALSLARGASPAYTNEENKTLRSDDLLYGKALGQEGAELPLSKYRPPEGTKEYSPDSSTNYYSISDLIDSQKLLDSSQQGTPILMPFKDKQPLVWGQDTTGANKNRYFDPIAKYTTRKGEDEKGKYLSYYDKYDFNNKLLNSLTEPYEMYDRIYYNEDPKTGKYMLQKQKGGSLPKYQGTDNPIFGGNIAPVTVGAENPWGPYYKYLSQEEKRYLQQNPGINNAIARNIKGKASQGR